MRRDNKIELEDENSKQRLRQRRKQKYKKVFKSLAIITVVVLIFSASAREDVKKIFFKSKIDDTNITTKFSVGMSTIGLPSDEHRPYGFGLYGDRDYG